MKYTSKFDAGGVFSGKADDSEPYITGTGPAYPELTLEKMGDGVAFGTDGRMFPLGAATAFAMMNDLREILGLEREPVPEGLSDICKL